MIHNIYYVCCVCGKTKHYASDGWGHVKVPVDANMSHGYCKECLCKAKEDIYAELNYTGPANS